MNGWETIQQFLENSNYNGVSFLVVVVLYYLFIFFLIQYFQNKKLFYLLYSLYAFTNATNLLKYIKGVFFSDFLENPYRNAFILSTHYPAQLLGTFCFIYFVVEIMNLRKSFPKSIHVLDWYFKVVSVIYMLLWLIRILNRKSFAIAHFHSWFFVPMGFIMLLWVLWMVSKQDLRIKKYIFSGMLILGICYIIISFATFLNTESINTYFSIFYIGILIESLLFALAIGLVQKMIYQENITIQKKYIEQLEENQIIKESMNSALSEELAQTKSDILEMTAEAQKERTEKLTAKLENKFSQLRLNALRSQMNPHFIFNALNSIKAYFIENDQEKAIFYLNKFSKLIRKILENSREEQITMAEEIDTVAMYSEIENDRFQNNIHISIDVDKQIDTQIIKVPALFLIPFVENAIWHGLATKEGTKELNIKVTRDPAKENVIIITVHDNGIGRKASIEKNKKNYLEKESIGLTLTKDRLDLFSKKFKKPYSYTIEDLTNNKTKEILGTLVTIYIPEVS